MKKTLHLSSLTQQLWKTIFIPYFLFATLSLGFHLFYYAYFFPFIQDLGGLVFYQKTSWAILWLSAFAIEYTTPIIWYIDGHTIYFPLVDRYVFMGPSCSGIKQCFQLIVVFTILPISWKLKVKTAFKSLLFLQLYNVFRVFCLCILMRYLPANWQFIHDYLFRPSYYIVIFLCWEYYKYKYSGFHILQNKV